MDWIDVCGPPGVGKSTICDPIWAPHELPIRQDILPPVEWHDFCNEIHRLLVMVQPDPSFGAALRMNQRSIRKMATVAARVEKDAYRKGGSIYIDNTPYIQTGLVQRGLGFGWRLNKLGIYMAELAHFFRLMPVSIGVVFLDASEDVVVARNRERLLNPETRHENRDYMVPLMRPAIDLAKEVLRERRVPILEIDTSDLDPEDCRTRVCEFATRSPCYAPPARPGGKMEVVSRPPWLQA